MKLMHRITYVITGENYTVVTNRWLVQQILCMVALQVHFS